MKSMFGYMPNQPYGLLQATSTLWSITSHITPINRHTHTHNGLACMQNAAITCTHTFSLEKKNFFLGGCGFFASDVISGGLFGHLGQLHLALGASR